MRKIIAAALVAGVVATPSTVLAHGSENGNQGKKPETSVAPAKVKKDDRGHKGKKAKKVPVVSMVFTAVVASDATAESVALASVDGVNRHAYRVLRGAETLTLKIATTKLKGTVVNADGTKRLAPETFADLKAGDRVMFVVRAKKNVLAAELPAAKWLRDFTVNAPAPAPTTPSDPVLSTPSDPGTGDPGTSITPL